MTIVEFLLARLADDTAEAKAAAHHAGVHRLPQAQRIETGMVWHTSGPRVIRKRVGDEHPKARLALIPSSNFDLADHIARWDPDRVLREVAAKRAIVDAHAHAHECIELSGSGDSSAGPCFVLRALAAVYADHPHYNPDWRP